MASTSTGIAKSLRSNTELFLIGQPCSNILGTKLPSRKQVLRMYFYGTGQRKISSDESAYLVTDTVMIFWRQAFIPTKERGKVKAQVQSLVAEWKTLQKNTLRGGATQIQKETFFVEQLDDLFDIAHANALKIISDPEDVSFLQQQRQKGRPGCMIGVDKILAARNKRRAEREKEDEERKKRAKVQNEMATVVTNYSSSESTASDNQQEYFCNESDLRKQLPTSARGSIKCITPDLVAVFDRCKTSDVAAVRILVAAAEAFQLDPRKYIINRTSLREARTQNRLQISAFLKENPKLVEAKCLSVHWDGKMLMDYQGGGKKIERLPVVLTYDGNEQLLGVPKISSGKGKGKRISEAVYGLLLEWEIAHRIQAISFDTTSTNTGKFQGASLLLEQLLERDLLYLPCRHHIYELQLKEVFEAKFGKMSGPGVPIFARFKEQWESIKDKPYSPGIKDDKVAAKIPVQVQIDTESFCLAQLKEQQPRGDYKEFLEIVLLFLGVNIPNHTFSQPGPISHARWMAKGIYCVKMFLFRKVLDLSENELNGLRDVTIFIVTLYIKAWFSSAKAVEAPNNDLNFLKAIFHYALIDETVSRLLAKRFCGHLWYLSGEAVAFALFDKNVPLDTKRKLAEAIRTFESNKEEYTEELSDSDMEESYDEGSGAEEDRVNVSPVHFCGFERVKRISLTPREINEEFLEKNLSHYVTPETGNFFTRLGLSKDFLESDPETWGKQKDYQQALETLRKLHVVNDSAERGVKLIEDYNNILCRNEEEKISLLQVVAENRKKYPLYCKNKLIN